MNPKEFLMMNQKFWKVYAVVQQTTINMITIFTSTQNQGEFVVLLFGVIKKHFG